VLPFWLFAQRHYRIVATVIVLAGLAMSLVGMQRQSADPSGGSKLTLFGAGVEIAGFAFILAARKKAA
jgi:hypothetical protein